MEDEYLSDDDLLKLTNMQIIDPYRVYYLEDTGEIYSITNEILSVDCQNVEIEFEKIEKFLTGKDNFVFYRLEFDEEDAIKFVNKRESPVLFKSNIIEYVRLNAHNNAVLQVTWTASGWLFKLDKAFAGTPRGKSVNSKLNFFVTKENNINYLIRSIEITLKNLLAHDSVLIDFTDAREKDVYTLAMFTLPFFETYGMTINDNN
jgi:hypothetical protein